MEGKLKRRYGFLYPMSISQSAQIDCRVSTCKYNKGRGVCDNVSPAISLNENGKFVCWTKDSEK
jgi:hypothetical protein